VSNAVLDKPGKLDPDEWEAMRRHPGLGEAVLQRVASFREIAVIAGAHHERLDDRGYPRGLGAESIGLDTRIITTADVFDALTADRPYRKRMSVDEALAIMRADAGKGIDPACLGALERGMAEVEAAAALAA
jgi:HD-GYP domain-containing protein (c-di-GMP phosphodiesterase class II)